MIKFDGINKVRVPKSVVAETEIVLRKAGLVGCEAFLLWVGIITHSTEFQIRRVLVPEQVCYKTKYGIAVRIEEDELFRISKHLYENSELAIAQVHSHPQSAYHSDIDDEIPLVTAIGQFSIVVPDFCSSEMSDLSNLKTYRLCQEGWKELSANAVISIFEVT